MKSRRPIVALAALMLLVATPAAWAAVQIITAAKSITNQSGTLRFWDMTGGTVTPWDSTGEWNAGTHSSTSGSAIAGTLTLSPSGATPPSSRAWWNQSWSTRRCFAIAGTGSAATAQRLRLTFDSATDIANGWLSATGADLRAIADDNTTQLSLHLLGPINSAATVVTVLADVPAAGTTVCLYSGNPSATSVSNSTPFIGTQQVDAGSTTAPSGWLTDAAIASWVDATPTSVLTIPATTAITNTTGAPNQIFQTTTTWDANTQPGPLTFTVPGLVPGTTATINAYFIENWSTTRRFDVAVNGGTVLSTFNVRNVAGGPRRAVLRTFTTTVTTAGTVTLSFAATPGLTGGLDPDPIISGFAVTAPMTTSAFTATGGLSEGLYATSGDWTSQVVDSGAGPAIYGALTADAVAPTLSGATYQIAASASPSGPWTYVGPDGSTVTSFTGPQQPTPTSIDGLRYSRIKVSMTSGSRLTSPTIGRLTLRAALPVLARPAGGRSTQIAGPQSTVLANDGSWVATQISTGFGGPPERAIDGNVDGSYFTGNSVQHSGTTSLPWWQVDIGRIQPISGVRLWNRTDCCDTRGTGITVYVSDVPFSATVSATPGVSSYTFPGTIGRPTELTIGRTGRYVRVQLNVNDWLHMAEVQILAPVALLTKITGTETGLVSLADRLVHESTSGASLTTNVQLGASNQIRLAGGTATLSGTAVAHSVTPTIISATGQLPGAGMSATHGFVYRAMWTGDQLRIERPMDVTWTS